MNIYKYLKFNVLILLFSFALTSEARWAGIEDVASEIEYYNVNIDIKSDGSSEELVEFSEVITKEAARDKAAAYRLSYNEGVSEIKIIEAYTIFNNVKYPVKADMIEDKAVASNIQGFDQNKQVLISFPNIAIGAKIHLKYTEKSKPILDNFYDGRRWFGLDEYWRKSKVTINSEIPLYIYVNDPQNVLEFQGVKKEKEIVNGKKALELFTGDKIAISLIKTLSHALVQGSEIGVIPAERYTWFTVSTVKKWEDLVKKLAPKYQAVITQPLPAAFEEIAQKASQIADEVEQINYVTSKLNDKIQYMGDWRTVHGKLFPRDLKEIASSQIGDCKDFSASTAAILRKLGHQAEPALVKRGINADSFEGLLSMSNFNHAFVKVTTKKGEIYWVDPTNFISMAQGIFPDIAGKQALVLSMKKASYEETPTIDPNHAQKLFSEIIEIKKADEINFQAKMTLKGERAIGMTGVGLHLSKKAIEDQLYSTLSNEHLEDKDKKEMILPDLSSRIVKDLTFSCKYQKHQGLIRTNLGYELLFSQPQWVSLFTKYVPGQMADLYLASPITVQTQSLLLNQKIKNPSFLNYTKDSKWLNINRKARIEGNNTYIEENVIIKKDKVLASELDSKEYQDLRKDLLKYFNGFAVILESEQL